MAQTRLAAHKDDFSAGALGMLLFQEDRFYPISGKVMVLSNVSLEPAFEVIQIGLLHDKKVSG